MVEPAGIEPASAIFNYRDSFTSLAGFWLQQAHLKNMPAFRRSEQTLSQATFCLLAVAASRIYWLLSSECVCFKIVVCDYYFVPFYLARHLQDLHHLNIRPRRNRVGPIKAYSLFVSKDTFTRSLAAVFNNLRPFLARVPALLLPLAFLCTSSSRDSTRTLSSSHLSII